MEARVLPAGSVRVEVVETNGRVNLYITGDSAANKIEIYQTSLDNYVVVGRTLSGATKINGKSNGTFRFRLGDISHDVRIEMGGSNDQVTIRGTSTGDGDLDFEDDLFVDMGSGNDLLTLKYLDIWQDLSVKMGTGADIVDAQYVDVDDDATFESTDTNGTLLKQKVTLQNVTVDDVLRVTLNDSLAVVNIVSSEADQLQVELGSGNDKLNIKKSKARLFDLDGGAGTDLLNFYSNSTAFTAVGFSDPTRKNIMFT
jgi:hypothetical protein